MVDVFHLLLEVLHEKKRGDPKCNHLRYYSSLQCMCVNIHQHLNQYINHVKLFTISKDILYSRYSILRYPVYKTQYPKISCIQDTILAGRSMSMSNCCIQDTFGYCISYTGYLRILYLVYRISLDIVSCIQDIFGYCVLYTGYLWILCLVYRISLQ